MYNLTAYKSLGKNKICVIWPETLRGRSGNDLANALLKFLEKVTNLHPSIKHTITWSDSCVLQNRNSIMSFVVTRFLLQNTSVETVTMKYSIAGHSCIPEVDNIHSKSEKVLRVSDVWSPLSLIRILLRIDQRKPFQAIQMKNMILEFHSAAKNLIGYKKVPYTKIRILQFKKETPF